MKSNVEIFSQLEVKLTKRQRVVPINESDLGFDGDGELVESEMWTSQESGYSVKLPDYAPYKYKRVVFQPIKNIKFKGTEQIFIEFKTKIKELLIIDIKNKREYSDEVLEEQVNSILLRLVNYDAIKTKRHYREYARKAAIDFYPQMAAFIDAKNNEYDSRGIEISFGNIAKSEFKLPAPRGNQHLISGLSKFFLEYYTQNQPAKNDIPLTEDLIFKNNEKVKSGVVKFDKQLVELFHYSFHFSILGEIKTFPQFPVSQRMSEFNLTVLQGKFIARFLRLLNYDDWRKNSYKYISPKFTSIPDGNLEAQVGSIRNSMKKYLKLYKNAGDYTT